MANKTEKDLKAFIKGTKNVIVSFNLRPKNGNQWIDQKKPKNVVEVCIPQTNGKMYSFSFCGIRGKYYDKLQQKYAKHVGFKYSGGAVEIL